MDPKKLEAVKDPQKLKIKIFADGANKEGMLAMYARPYIKGFTTNPTLMRKAGISDYKAFAQDVLKSIKDRPISFEVFSDDLEEMERQAVEIASWGTNVYVKIPVTNTKGTFCGDVIRALANKKVKMNVTAVMTLEQIKQIVPCMNNGVPGVISVFAGRVADTGRDPVPHMQQALTILKPFPNLELLWASPRELLNIFQADEIGCHIITVTNDILEKLSLLNKDLSHYSLETVQMFYNDAQKSGFSL